MSETRWLTDSEQQAWRQLAAILHKLPVRLERQLHADSGMTHFEYWVIAMLSEAPDRTLQIKELAEQSNASLSRLSHVLTRLAERGWVRRERSDVDGRVSNAVLTEEGWETVVAAAPGHVEAVRDAVFENLTAADVNDLARVCGAIADRLDGVPGK